jgi:hypothetical protein
MLRNNSAQESTTPHPPSPLKVGSGIEQSIEGIVVAMMGERGAADQWRHAASSPMQFAMMLVALRAQSTAIDFIEEILVRFAKAIIPDLTF